jgi:hypothetical protein
MDGWIYGKFTGIGKATGDEGRIVQMFKNQVISTRNHLHITFFFPLGLVDLSFG